MEVVLEVMVIMEAREAMDPEVLELAVSRKEVLEIMLTMAAREEVPEIIVAMAAKEEVPEVMVAMAVREEVPEATVRQRTLFRLGFEPAPPGLPRRRSDD
uniref:Uncharacterized protein n=1 Tax=Cacopsylla melanoneura TaxID=428564 RepID=A0A8D8M830_9HEMI